MLNGIYGLWSFANLKMTRRCREELVELRKELYKEWKRPSRGTFVSIGNKVGCDRRCVARHFHLFEEGRIDFEDRPRSGRPPKATKADKRKICRHLKQTHLPCIRSAIRGFDGALSVSTARRIVRKDGRLGYGQIARAKVSSANRELRSLATTVAKQRLAKKRLKHLIFLDATQIRWKRGKALKVHRNRLGWSDKEHPRQQDLQGFQAVQFYAAFTLGPDGALHRSKAIFVPAKEGFTAQYFVRHVAGPILKWAREEVFGDGQFWMVQDNAKQHQAKSSRAWMERVGYRLHEHPAQSPDLNRIEKAWVLLKLAMERKRPRSLAALQGAVECAWQDLPSHSLQSFIHQLPDVMKEVHKKPQALCSR